MKPKRTTSSATKTARKSAAKPAIASAKEVRILRRKTQTLADRVDKLATRPAPAVDTAPAESTVVAQPAAAVPAAARLTKRTQVTEMLSTSAGATLGEIVKATGWQKHTIRAFIAVTIRKEFGDKLVSSRPAGGERTYRIVE